MNHIIEVNTQKWVGCSLCEKVCVAHNIEIKDNKASIFANDCLMCGQCSAVCPKEAITISGYEEKSVEKRDDVRLDPDKVLDVIRFRRTIRQFQNKDIPKKAIEQILEAGRLTHTAKNSQDVSFIILDKEKSSIEKMAVRLFNKIKPIVDIFSPLSRRNKIKDNFFFFNAPIVIVITAENKINGILAAQNMEFVAEANELGVLYSGYFTVAANISRQIKKTLGITKGKKVATTLVIGYPKVNFLRSAQREKLDVKYL